jgi:hypothetical protein
MKKSKKVQDREMFQGANKRLKTEAQLKAEMEASNKKAVKNLGNKRQLTEDEYQDFLDEVGGADQLEAYDFDGTVGSANKIKKQQADYMAEMQMEYRKGKLDPEPGSRTPQRKRFLQSKLDEAEASGDARLLSREEREELFDLDDIEDFAGGGRAGFKGGGLTPEDYLKVKDMLNHWHDYKKGGGTLSKTKFANAFFRENNADGGVAGLLGERTGFRGGGAYQGGTSSRSRSRSGPSRGPAGGASAGGNYGGNVNPNQTYAGRTLSQRPSNYGGTGPSTTSGGGGGPPGTNTGGGTTTTPTTTQPNFREIVRQKQILDYLNSLEEEDLALGAGPTVLGTILKEGVKGFKPKISKKGLGLEYLKEMDPYGNSLKFNLGTEYKDLLKGKLKPKLELKGTKGDLEYGFGVDKDKNINFGITMPTNLFNKPKSKSRNFKNRLAPDISKFNFEDLTGIKSTIPANRQMAKVYGAPELTEFGATPGMFKDTAKFNDMEKYQEIANKQMSIDPVDGSYRGKEPSAIRDSIKLGSSLYGIDMDNIPKDFLETKEDFKNQKILGDIEFAEGGIARQNFKMGKRAFLKAMLGTGAGIAGLKSGLFGMGGKEATKKAVKEVAKQSAGSGTPPPYFFKLVEKIKTMGDDTLATQDKAIAKKYKDYTMEEDFAGNIEIIKKGDDVAEDVYMSYKVDEVPVKGKKGSAKVEEYEEFTARPDAEGKMKDIEPGVPDEVVNEGSVFEDNMTEFGMTKKASGGIARMLGE